jgi:hypothetical protein
MITEGGRWEAREVIKNKAEIGKSESTNCKSESRKQKAEIGKTDAGT